MKKLFLVILFISMSVIILGCEESNGESTDQETSSQNSEENTDEGNNIILVGTPNLNGEGSSVDMDQEISDSKTIDKVEEIIGTAEKIEKPQNKVNGDPDLFFTITKSEGTKKDTPEEKRFVWYHEDGSAVLSDGSGEYYNISSNQAGELKEALNK
ncbi:hypothetical protein SAMN04487936_103395 [Halobacillus dabanensis]|uniref:Lipoprotein n=1 Tax=Halobacillus dabanensis TaxID=240302 RepID=A0A1I3THL2_HALDA|nr:hypothetical protein [Halobacillus dabanensis]SFJ70385.1 hypothetical protein SAMN04487936_103395 [Halobacillus dabanensis]